MGGQRRSQRFRVLDRAVTRLKRATPPHSAAGLSELEERENKRTVRDRSELDRLPNSS